MRVQFAGYCLDTDLRCLKRGGETVALQPKAYELLEYLVSKRPKAVSRQELSDYLWPNTFVERGSLHNLVYQLRAALEDDGHAIIRTVHRYGFAFGELDGGPPPLSCQLSIGDRLFELREGDNIVGRDRASAVRINAPSVSRRHARIILTSDRAVLEDLGSKNGTAVGGRALHAPTPLKDGDMILFGEIEATFQASPSQPSTETLSGRRRRSAAKK
jgi:hypothetical protein